MSIVSPGQSARGFSLSGIDGKIYTLNKDGAHLTLAVFFKTTCPTCMLAWPYLERLHQTYRGAGLAVWGISQDVRDLSADLASNHGSTFPILIDSDLRISRTYDPEFVPTILLIDRHGQIADSVVAFDKAKLNHLSQTIAARLGVPAAIIAPADDGNPVFKPG
ncbi:MAG: TlpA family protein disulfide reductase [Chloroflexi bacterium]|nr:TlpA family protein disulfide reductase [Chloroflexota bacterium]